MAFKHFELLEEEVVASRVRWLLKLQARLWYGVEENKASSLLFHHLSSRVWGTMLELVLQQQQQLVFFEKAKACVACVPALPSWSFVEANKPMREVVLTMMLLLHWLSLLMKHWFMQSLISRGWHLLCYARIAKLLYWTSCEIIWWGGRKPVSYYRTKRPDVAVLTLSSNETVWPIFAIFHEYRIEFWNSKFVNHFFHKISSNCRGYSEIIAFLRTFFKVTKNNIEFQTRYKGKIDNRSEPTNSKEAQFSSW